MDLPFAILLLVALQVLGGDGAGREAQPSDEVGTALPDQEDVGVAVSDCGSGAAAGPHRER
jgi:hypothetical protein